MTVLQWSEVKRRTVNKQWWVMSLTLLAVMTEVMTLSGPNVCIVKQKYNVTKRVKYRAPMSVRTYEWCLAVPPRCSRYTTEMRDLTRLENEERTAEIAVCCPGYKMKGDFTCTPICPYGKTGSGCAADCPPNKWGPNCVHQCKNCSDHGKCSSITGECVCHTEWQGESCETRILATTTMATTKASLLTTSIAVLTTLPSDTSSLATNPAPSQLTTSTTTKKISNQSVNEDVIKQETKTFYDETEPQTTRFPYTNVQINLLPEKETDLETTSNIFSEKTSFTTERSTAKTAMKTTSNKNDRTKAVDPEELKTTVQKTSKTEEQNEKTTVDLKYDNSTITPWTVARTYKSLSTAPTTKSNAPESAISTRYDIPRKILPFTKVEIGKSTSKDIETTKKPEPTLIIPTTAKFKPKEIWIKPAQKGEMPIPDWKLPSSKSKQSTEKEPPSTTTTPRTIIVSIIPTSMSYSTFKKIYLTTASSLHTQQLKISQNTDSHGTTTINSNSTTPIALTLRPKNSVPPKTQKISTTTAMPTVKTSLFHGSTAASMLTETTKSLHSEATNSMSMTNEVHKLNYPSVPTVPSMHRAITSKLFSGANTIPPKREKSQSPKTSTMKTEVMPTPPLSIKPITERNISANITDKARNNTTDANPHLKEVIAPKEKTKTTNTSMEATMKLTTAIIVTNAETNRDEEETFPILTEPEHITAVAGDRPSEISTVDLIYVLTIVGGMVMSIITIAVVIVMFERCKRHRYGDLMKMNNIRMQVVIDTNDRPPPPYVRSIFHTPLPDPPMSDKCHYQPISTLDRNLKQFMRPVVVQAISPLMLENFRGILECHYDHLPRRSHDFKASECGRNCCSMAPSVDINDEPSSSRGHSVIESTIEALKCEAEEDEIENSEPLYAEIPCWRPPSAHAVEVVNVNGEAITEL